MRYQSSNYLCQVLPEKLNLILVDEFLNNPPTSGLGFVYKDGWVDDEFTVDASCLHLVPLDATHIVWFKHKDELKQAIDAAYFDLMMPR